MILCDVIGCELEHGAKAIRDTLNEGKAPVKAYCEFHQWCDRCKKLIHWERLEDGTARTMRGADASTAA